MGEQALRSHMSKVGKVVDVEMKKGSAVVTYSNTSMAQRAEETLHKSTVVGNNRFLDVWLDKKSLPTPPPLGTGQKRSFSFGGGRNSSEGGSCKVLVRGFDFGTSDEQLMSHMSKVGTATEVYWLSQGAANVVFSTSEEATSAIQQLNKTTMDGNSRFIDVIAGGDLSADRAAKRFKGEGKGMSSFGKGSSWGKDKGKGKGKGKSKGKGKGGDHSDEDPAGSGRVFVKGFDFGTEDDQLESYMSTVGPVHTIHWVNQGSAIVVYTSKAAAVQACSVLEKTTIPGNARYIEVSPR